MWASAKLCLLPPQPDPAQHGRRVPLEGPGQEGVQEGLRARVEREEQHQQHLGGGDGDRDRC